MVEPVLGREEVGESAGGMGGIGKPTQGTRGVQSLAKATSEEVDRGSRGR